MAPTGASNPSKDRLAETIIIAIARSIEINTTMTPKSIGTLTNDR